MHRVALLLLGGLIVVLMAVAGPASAQDAPVIGVSWSDFQDGRWKRDEAGMVSVIWERGGTYLSADAQASVEKQRSDVGSLIARGIDVLILQAQDAEAILPEVDAAVAAGIPVIGYDRLIDHEGAYAVTFDEREVGRLQARAVLQAQPTGDYVFIKGSPSDPNTDVLHAGQVEVLQPHIDSGAIAIVADVSIDGWLPRNAEHTMREILAATDNQVDAVVAASDGLAGGAIAALASEGMAGTVPVSGQDGDTAALNRIARGTQTVSVWKDSFALGSAAAEIAFAMAGGVPFAASENSEKWTGPNGHIVGATFLAPIPITRDTLHIVLDARWITRTDLCDGVPPGTVTICD